MSDLDRRHLHFESPRSPRRRVSSHRLGRSYPGKGFWLNLSKKRYYILFVSRDDDGTLNKVPVPMHYAYGFVAAAVIGLFTITGLAGSYSRMLIKMSRFNQVRQDRDLARADNAHLTQALHEKDVQAASLGSLATEVSAIYGFTANKLSLARGVKSAGKQRGDSVAKAAATAPLTATGATMTDESYFKSLDTFYALRTAAVSGTTAQALAGPSFGSSFGQPSLLGGPSYADSGTGANIPSLWPVMGQISSSFGQREDPVLGNGEGEFHKGLDIRAPDGTPVRATADGTVKLAGMVNGYGREVVIDHGHGLETCYAHLSRFAAMSGETVVRGQVIGYVGHSGRVTGSNLHYEVRIQNIPVNPHKYLRVTMAELGSSPTAGN
jgi:murein DD-endopeptidase MepM/ murein hydrolase activator NlpD